MAFFFDMDNPALRDDSRKKSLEVDLQSMIHDVELEIVPVYDALREKDASRVLFDKVTPEVVFTYEAYIGERLQALVAGTKEVVSKTEIRPYKSFKKIFHEPEDSNKFRVEFV